MALDLKKDQLAEQRQILRVILSQACTSQVHAYPITNQLSPPFLVINEPTIDFDTDVMGLIRWVITMAGTRLAPQARCLELELELQRALLALGRVNDFMLESASPTTIEDNEIELNAYQIFVSGVLTNC